MSAGRVSFPPCQEDPPTPWLKYVQPPVCWRLGCAVASMSQRWRLAARQLCTEAVVEVGLGFCTRPSARSSWWLCARVGAGGWAASTYPLLLECCGLRSTWPRYHSSVAPAAARTIARTATPIAAADAAACAVLLSALQVDGVLEGELATSQVSEVGWRALGWLAGFRSTNRLTVLSSHRASSWCLPAMCQFRCAKASSWSSAVLGQDCRAACAHTLTLPSVKPCCQPA